VLPGEVRPDTQVPCHLAADDRVLVVTEHRLHLLHLPGEPAGPLADRRYRLAGEPGPPGRLARPVQQPALEQHRQPQRVLRVNRSVLCPFSALACAGAGHRDLLEVLLGERVRHRLGVHPAASPRERREAAHDF
jgi:hypothetical protein